MINSIKYLLLTLILIFLGFANELSFLDQFITPIVKLIKLSHIRIAFLVLFCLISTKTFAILIGEIPKVGTKMAPKLFLLFAILFVLLTYINTMSTFCIDRISFFDYSFLEPLILTLFPLASILVSVLYLISYFSSNALDNSIDEMQAMLKILNKHIDKSAPNQ